MPAMKTYREAVFSGWFGPMGVGAVFLSIIAKEELETAYEGKEAPVSIQVIRPVVLFIVFCSVLVHGTTIPLFQLGKRIRTRTLSITSISSNQVLRLPKLQFGQQPHKKHDHDYKKDDASHTMTELERNTLFNTIQHDRIKEDHTAFAIDMMNRNDSDSDLPEEDFLPDDSSDTLHNNSQPRITIPELAIDDVRRGSTVSVDTQIRFIEPVIPRTPLSSTTDKTDPGTSNIKNWLLRNKEEDIEPPEQAHTDQHHHGIKHLFKRRKHVSTGESSKADGEGLHPRIEVWEEPHHVVVEDTQGQVEGVVIDKADHEDWRKETRNKVEEVKLKIKTGDET